MLPQKPRIIMAGKLPPPYFGQAIMIDRHWQCLQSWDAVEAHFLELAFTRTASEVRKISLHKLLELSRIRARLAPWRIQPADMLLFPSGGPHLVPVLRDILLIPMLRRATRKLVVHFHAAGIADRMNSLPSPLRKKLLNVYSQVDSAIVLTNYGKRDAQALGIPEIEILPNSVPDNPARIQHNKPEGRVPVFYNIGQQCEEKGTLVLIEAFAEYRKQGGKGHLRLAGDCVHGLTSSALSRLLREKGLADVCWYAGILTGADLDKFVAESDIFVFPTRAPQEACPLVLLEAMQAGKPIIATDWHANAELIPDGNKLLPPNHRLASLLTTSLLEMEAQPHSWSVLGKQNRTHYESFYSEQSGNEHFLSALDQLLAS